MDSLGAYTVEEIMTPRRNITSISDVGITCIVAMALKKIHAYPPPPHIYMNQTKLSSSFFQLEQC